MDSNSKGEQHIMSIKFHNFLVDLALVAVLFWSVFWPVSYFVQRNINNDLRIKIESSEYLPNYEKQKLLN